MNTDELKEKIRREYRKEGKNEQEAWEIKLSNKDNFQIILLARLIDRLEELNTTIELIRQELDH